MRRQVVMMSVCPHGRHRKENRQGRCEEHLRQRNREIIGKVPNVFRVWPTERGSRYSSALPLKNFSFKLITSLEMRRSDARNS